MALALCLQLLCLSPGARASAFLLPPVGAGGHLTQAHSGPMRGHCVAAPSSFLLSPPRSQPARLKAGIDLDSRRGGGKGEGGGGARPGGGKRNGQGKGKGRGRGKSAVTAAGQQGMQGTDLLVYLLDRNDRAVAELKASMKEGFKEVKSQVKEGGAVLGKRLEQGEARLRALEDLLLRAQTLLAVAIFLYGVVQKWEVIKSFVSSLFS